MLVKFDNGVEVDFDIYDAETADYYADIKSNIVAASEEVVQLAETKPGDAMRKMFSVVSEGCDILFGAGMGEKICGSRPNMMIALNVFSKIRDSEDKQIAEMKKLSDVAAKKYRPKKK